MTSVVQFNSISNGGGLASLSCSFTNPIAAGSFIVAVAHCDIGTFTIADDKSDALTDSGIGIFHDVPQGAFDQIGAFLAATTGAKTVTVTCTGGLAFEILIWEVAGISSPVFDKFVHAGGNSAGPAASGFTGTLSASSEIALAYGTTSDAFTGAGSGWTLDAITAFNDIGEHIIIASSASIQATAPLSASGLWQIYCVTLMSGGGGPANPFANSMQVAQM